MHGKNKQTIDMSSEELCWGLDLILVLMIVLLIIVVFGNRRSNGESNDPCQSRRERRDPEWLKEPEGPGPAPPSYECALRFGSSLECHR
jgi:hypothetical protein